MSLVSKTIPTLINGISQQPPTMRLPSQCEDMVNCYPTVDSFLQRRRPTKHIAQLLSGSGIKNAHIHTINRDAQEKYLVVIVDGEIMVFDFEGNKKTVNLEASLNYFNDARIPNDIRCMSIADYTFTLNTRKKVEMSLEKSPPFPNQALVFVKQVNYSTTFQIILDETHTATYATDTSSPLSSTTVATGLMNSINGFGPYTATMSKSTILIKRTDGGEFTIKVSDSRSNTHLSLATKEVQTFSDLPTVAPNGYVVEVIGSATSTFDNYFVRFETNANSSDFDQGVWKEAVKPDITTTINPSTMPHALVREADGTFTFKAMEWEPRECGDEESIPAPSFIGRTISSMFYYRNRLGFLSRENAILSESGKFFNFFATTATAMVDSDVIDVAASGEEEAPQLYHAVPFSEGLICFSMFGQFKLEHPSETLAVSTVALTPLTSFEASPEVQPQGAGQNIFFVTPQGEYSSVMEYYVQEDTSLTDAANTTGHVPCLVPSGVYQIVVSSNQTLLLVLSSKNRKEVCGYKYIWNGNQKLQAAWFRWNFEGEILGAAFMGTYIYFVVRYPDGLHLEMVDVQPGLGGYKSPFPYHLDRLVYDSETSSIYNDITNETTVTLPYPTSHLKSTLQLVTCNGGKLAEGLVFRPKACLGYSFVFDGDIRYTPFVVGTQYTSFFTFSQFIMQNSQDGPPIIGGRLQVRNVKLVCERSGGFEATVTQKYRQPSIYKFTGRKLTDGDNRYGDIALTSGMFNVPVLSKADQVTITLSSNSFLPFQFINAEWEGFYTKRSNAL